MIPACTPVLRMTTPNMPIGAAFTAIQQKNVHIDLGTYVPKKSSNVYLSVETVQKMLWRFLNEVQMPKEKLAYALGITVKSLGQLCYKKAPDALISKINLPLVRLYCRTQF